MRLQAKPCSLKQANDYTEKLHRHHKPVTGHRFSIAAFVGDDLVGVIIVGRPVARNTDQYLIAEVTRLTTNGYKNACSFLYGRAARAAEAMGFLSIQTFTLESESGNSLRAAGWTHVNTTNPTGAGWNSRANRNADQNGIPKKKWEKVLGDDPQHVGRAFGEDLRLLVSLAVRSTTDNAKAIVSELKS